MKALIYLLALASLLFANADKADIVTCEKCHPIIAAEFESSMHKKSSIYDDKIHKAVWDLHPATKKGKYKCAKCHTPNIAKEEDKHQGITCITCHTIKDVVQNSKSNKNVYEKKAKTFYSAEAGRENEKLEYKQTSEWFGMQTKTVGSAYNDIDYRNENFYNGYVYKRRTDSIETFYYRDTVVDVSQYVKTAIPSYYNYSSTFYSLENDEISGYDSVDYNYESDLNYDYNYDFYYDTDNINKSKLSKILVGIEKG